MPTEFDHVPAGVVRVHSPDSGDLDLTWPDTLPSATQPLAIEPDGHMVYQSAPGTVATRAASIGTAYQPNVDAPVLVTASVQISSGAAGDGKIELLCDENNPPTTVRGTFRVGTALTVIGGQLSCVVPAGHYWKLASTNTAGTPAHSIVGNVQEVTL